MGSHGPAHTFLNVLFLGGLLTLLPEQGFLAISTRGDWMLQESQTEPAKTARSILFASAGKLEWLYDLSVDNPYELTEEERKTGSLKIRRWSSPPRKRPTQGTRSAPTDWPLEKSCTPSS